MSSWNVEPPRVVKANNLQASEGGVTSTSIDSVLCVNMATCGTFAGFATRMRMNQPHSNKFQINRRVSHDNVSEAKKDSNLTEAKITAHDVANLMLPTPPVFMWCN